MSGAVIGPSSPRCAAILLAWPGAAFGPHTVTSIKSAPCACSTWWQVLTLSPRVCCCAILGTVPSTGPKFQSKSRPLRVSVTNFPAQARHLPADACTKALALSGEENRATVSMIRFGGSWAGVCTIRPLTAVKPGRALVYCRYGGFVGAGAHSGSYSVHLGLRSWLILSPRHQRWVGHNAADVLRVDQQGVQLSRTRRRIFFYRSRIRVGGARRRLGLVLLFPSRVM